MNSSNVVRRSAATTQAFPWGKLTWFASRALGNSAELTTGCCEIVPQAANPRHSHPNCEEVLHVLRGRIAHTLGDEEIVLEPGDTIAIPPRVPHNARNLGTEDAVLLISFSSADRQTQGE
jgi:quercetin dioxygenase-like cupin family protein